MNFSLSLLSLGRRIRINSSVRSLFSSSYLGLQRYWRRRENTRLSDEQRSCLFSDLNSALADKDGHVHTELFACFLHVADDSAQHQELLYNLIDRYNAREEIYRFWYSGIGSYVMRYCYHFMLIDKAKQMLLREDLGDFFHQNMSFLLVMNALYTAERYADVVQVCDRLCQLTEPLPDDAVCESVLVDDDSFKLTLSPSAIMLSFAACYKLGTAESADWMQKQFTRVMSSDEPHIFRRAAALCIQSLVNMGRYKEALAALELRPDKDFGIFRDIRIKLLSKMDNVGEALHVLRSSFEKCSIPGTPHYRYRCVPDAISALKTAVERRADPEITSEFKKLHDAILSYDYINSAYLDDVLCAPFLNRDDDPSHRPANFVSHSSSASDTSHSGSNRYIPSGDGVKLSSRVRHAADRSRRSRRTIGKSDTSDDKNDASYRHRGIFGISD